MSRLRKGFEAEGEASGGIAGVLRSGDLENGHDQLLSPRKIIWGVGVPNEIQRSLCDWAMRDWIEEKVSTHEHIYGFGERCLEFLIADWDSGKSVQWGHA